MNQCLILQVLANGSLKVSLTNEGREELQELIDNEKPWHERWPTLFEYTQGNSEYKLLAPEHIGALTEAPIIGEGYYYGDDGELTCYPDAKVWWFEQYMVENEFESMLRDGYVVFTASLGNQEITK